MEDLLASIRRAIHDDIGGMPPAAADHSQGAIFKGDMRELRVKSDEASAAALEIKDLRDKIGRSRAAEIVSGEPPRLPDPRLPHLLRPSFAERDWDGEGRALEPAMLSAEAEAAAGTAFSKLANTLLSRPGGGQPIEGLTRELLRGMLKDWLDANLPALVERLVREEIERVARRR